MRIWQTQPIASFPGGNGTTKVEQAIRELALKINFISAALTTAVSGVQKTILELIPSLTATIYVILKDGGQKQVATKVPVAALFEYAQNGEGVIQLRKNADGTANYLRGAIQISPEGALQMVDDETIHIEFNGFDTEVIQSIDLYGIEAPQLDFTVNQYSNLSIAQDQIEKTFDCRDLTEMIIPVSATITELLISYSNNRTCRYLPEELRHISLGSNDVAVTYDHLGLAGAPQHGYSSYYILGLADAVEIKVVTNGNGLTLHGVKTVAAVAPSRVAPVNAQLQSTTEATLLKDAQTLNQNAAK